MINTEYTVVMTRILTKYLFASIEMHKNSHFQFKRAEQAGERG